MQTLHWLLILIQHHTGDHRGWRQLEFDIGSIFPGMDRQRIPLLTTGHKSIPFGFDLVDSRDNVC